MKLKEPLIIINSVASVTVFLVFTVFVAGLCYAEGLTSWDDRFTAGVLIGLSSVCIFAVEVIACLVLLLLNGGWTLYRIWTRKLSTQLGCAWLLFGGTTVFVVPTVVLCWHLGLGALWP